MSGKEKIGLLITFVIVAGVWIAVQGVTQSSANLSVEGGNGFMPFKSKQIEVADVDLIDTAKKALVVISGPDAAPKQIVKDVPVVEPEPIVQTRAETVQVVPVETVQVAKVEKIVPTVANTAQATHIVDAVIDKPTEKVVRNRIYQVKTGDNLGKIATMVYGDKNVLKNIDVIYLANKDKLKSKNSVKVGQELVIPAVDDSKSIVSVANDKRIADLRSLAAKHSDTLEFTNVSATTLNSKRLYVVKDGDSLWKIAKKELGDGKRYTEILKMNKKIENDKTLKPGSRIFIPS